MAPGVISAAFVIFNNECFFLNILLSAHVYT